MRARWAEIDENIGTKMCWKLVDDVSGELVCRSTIRSAIEAGTAYLQIGLLESLPDSVEPSELTLLDDFISLANFKTPL